VLVKLFTSLTVLVLLLLAPLALGRVGATTPDAGTANTGGGGGGGGPSSSNIPGGNGGSGVVIIVTG
jgi:hypothetical protein